MSGRDPGATATANFMGLEAPSRWVSLTESEATGVTSQGFPFKAGRRNPCVDIPLKAMGGEVCDTCEHTSLQALADEHSS